MSGTTVAVDPQLGSGLVQIPLEILIRITYFISTKDLGSVRLTCKALEQSLFNFFSHEFFRKKQFMVTSDSLQALIDISQHPSLSTFLKHVIITADRPSAAHWVADRNNEARARLELANADHLHLMATGGLRDMLAEAFAKLPNLETVDIRDFNAHSRNRDGRGTQWRSWGATTLAATTNAPVTSMPRMDHDPYSSQLFCAVTAALAAAQARPKSLEVLIRSSSWMTFGLHDTAFYFPPRIEASMASLLANLKSLHLTLALTHNARMRPFMLQKFLSLATNLTWLRLNFENTGVLEQEELFSWLALKDTQSPSAPFDMDPVQLSHLERLDLGSVEIKPGTLLGLVAKFTPTLTSLYLRRVSLFDPENRDRTTKTNPWERCLSALCRLRGLDLRVLDFSQITHSYDGFKGNVTFKTSDTASGVPSRDWRCCTNLVTLDKAIAQAVAAMVPEMPKAPDPDAMDEDNSEEEDEDDEEESDGEGEDDGEDDS
ncbi:hypothetical protein C8A01DRAFT_38325 [Parachaetomium inaequale]|uniref:F-box domain-containing protein n=1 Tax=Parachaetomium inaequale TaxID=2588326 RepID=A0AAN6SPW2_9PEZI|nr:hypothetical protein C8A01DRAFT_38325 [Parachaetomium inaequale]